MHLDPCAYVPPAINNLQPYLPGMSVVTLAAKYQIDPSEIVKLASNENPYGMSPRVSAALPSLLPSASRYPNGQALAQAIAAQYGLRETNVVLGNGSNDVLDMIARVFLRPGVAAVSSQYAFSIYRILTQTVGADNVVVTAKDCCHDLTAMAAAVTPRTRVIWIANPNNPTGTFVPYPEVRAFLRSVSADIAVVLDEAYYEYLAPEQRADTIAWLRDFPNLILTRTFSKAYGLAGLRIGYGLAGEAIISLLQRVRQPFNVNELGLEAALIALGDQDFVQQSCRRNKDGLRQLQSGFDELGLSYLPASGNFVAVKLEHALATHEALLHQGIIVRPLAEYDMPEYLRVSVGLPAENKRFLTALGDILRH